MGPIVIAQFHLTPRLFESICYACCLSLFLISHHPLSSGFWSRCFTEQLLLRLPTNPTLFEPMKNFQFSVYGSALSLCFFSTYLLPSAMCQHSPGSLPFCQVVFSLCPSQASILSLLSRPSPVIFSV